MSHPRSGLQTTEFWTWLITFVTSTVFAAIILHRRDVGPWEDLGVYAGKAIIDLISGVAYIWARAHVKGQHAKLDVAELTRLRRVLDPELPCGPKP